MTFRDGPNFELWGVRRNGRGPFAALLGIEIDLGERSPRLSGDSDIVSTSHNYKLRND